MARPVFLGLIAAITLLALYPQLTLPEPVLTQGDTPYYNHVFAFVTLAITGAIGWGLRWRLISGLALYAAAIELAQSLSPGRETALYDLLASLSGLAVGCTLVLLFSAGKRWRLSQWRSAGAP